MSKLAVVGSRSLKDISQALLIAKDIIRSRLQKYDVTEIVSGGADGPDKWAEDIADQYELWLTVYTPNWDYYGKSAGFIRNKRIIERADNILLFWDGKSRGTTHDLNLARKSGKNYELFLWKNDNWSLNESNIVKLHTES